jgi:2'-5' RNA ligase
LRLFVALDISEEARDVMDALGAQCRDLDLPARYEAREKQHVTLAFLGATAPERLAEVEGAISAAARASAPFMLTLDTVGAFPDERRARILWLGSSAPNPQFEALAASVRDGLGRLGWIFDKAAVAHVTICRLKRFVRGLPTISLPRPARVEMDEVVLYESLPAGRTTRYEVRLRAPLGRP